MTCKFCSSTGHIIIIEYLTKHIGGSEKPKYTKVKIKDSFYSDCPKCNGTGNVIK